MQIKPQQLTHRSVIFSVTVFLLVLVVGGTIFMLSMQQIIRGSKRGELIRLLENERLKLELPVRDKINIVLKMADSPLIRRYFANPSDKELEAIAFEEIDGYRRALTGSFIFWVNDIDKKFYSGDGYVYTLDPSDTVNYWYNMTLYETDVFNFNINYNPDLNDTRLWINAPVLDSERKPLGILGTGIDISVFINAIYNDYCASAEFYLFNALGEITGAKNISLVTEKRKLTDEFGEIGEKIFDTAKQLDTSGSVTFGTPLGKVGVTSIPTFGWYALAVAPKSISDYKIAIVWLFVTMLAVMGVILVVLNIFIAKLSEPLQRTMKDLEAASKSKSDFLAKMSHEIRTPMNAISGMAELALREKTSLSAAQEYVRTIKRASANLLSIINDILDLSKIESGKLEIIPVEYRLPQLIADVVNIIKMRLIESPVRFDVNMDSDIPSVLFGDEVRVRQILLNILSNAVKYTEEGRISCAISGMPKDDGTVLLTVEVADTGKGIKEEDLAKLFSNFVQVDTAANRGIEGTGLGLAITKNLTKAMGGDITVSSVYGKGSTFTITLPQKIRSHEPVGTGAVFDKPAEAQSVRFTAPDAHVLAVDDIDTNLEVIEGLLAPYKMRVDAASSGEEAVAAIKARRYDLVFMDHMMPGMDGVEAVKRIRALADEGERYQYVKDMPIIALTANAVSGAKEMFMQNGFDDFLPKPIDPADLDSALEKWIVGGTPVSATDASPFSGKTMLLAEDTEINRDILIALLEDTGLAIDCASNGLEALNMVEAAPDKYDIVMMDVYMPEMNGLDATRRIRALPQRAGGRLPIIAMTGNVFKEDIDECIAAGMDDHLGKPFDFDKVLETLRKYLSAKPPFGTEAESPTRC